MRKICIVTSTRADYGLLYWLMKGVQLADEYELQLIVTGMHLSEKFGDTWKQIEEDSFEISKKVSLGNLLDSKKSVIAQISIGVEKFFDAYEELTPDLVVILGDRYEMLAAAQSALFAGIPIAHLCGGEVTEGAFDDIVRNSITKMSTYHFVSTDESRKRVIQMGERPECVFTAGAPGLENIRKLDLISKAEMESKLNFKFKKKNVLITYHPVTAANEDATKALIEALDDYNDCGQIITLPNSDPGYDKIIQQFKKYAATRDNVFLTTSLGSLNYLSVMKVCNIVIGNSSSGITEAPFMGTPTLNIGVRQKGRLQARSVINVNAEKLAIKAGIEKALLMSPESSSLYGDGFSTQKILESLKELNFDVKKGFYDI